jgi:RNA polymerase primary sigma factor
MEMKVAETSFLELFSLAVEEALNDREQSFVELRYGIASGEPHTLEQVAQVFSLSRERIRQVLERSCAK